MAAKKKKAKQKDISVMLSKRVFGEIQAIEQEMVGLQERKKVVLGTVLAQAEVPDGWAVKGIEDHNLIVGPPDAEE